MVSLRLPSRLLPTALSLLLAGCGSVRPGASVVASSREAMARSQAKLPPVQYALQLESPDGRGEAKQAIPWLEVRGRTGTAELYEADVVIALDTSVSTLFPSGEDLDDDGIIGELRGVVKDSSTQRAGVDSLPQTQGPAWHIPLRNWTTDYDDTIFQAELLASRALIQGLGERGNRIGVISYCARARRRAAIGAPQDALAAVARIRSTTDASPTDLAAALNDARRELLRLDPGPWPRQRAVILFTDGRPTAPKDVELARLQAIYEAEALAERGIDLYVIRFGPIGIPEGRFLLALAGAAGGRIFPVGDPHRLLNDLPPVQLGPRRLDIENLTSGARARGLVTGSDGRFDGFVSLTPGPNRIRLSAELGDGTLAREDRQVYYDPPDRVSEEQRLAEQRVLRLLREREGSSGARAVSAPTRAQD